MPSFLTEPVPPEEAAALIKDKPAVTKAVWKQMLPELQARSFTVSGVESADVLQAVRDRIADPPGTIHTRCCSTLGEKEVLTSIRKS
jgi:hypothetical protein